ncbi:unnamed protein product [Rotaria sp. Silwood2]|nr:unnamed protein product [Rotaria sp. Silwood2]
MSQERDESDDRSNSKSSRHHDYLVKLHGISCSSNKDDIKKFLYPCRIVAIHLFENNGTSSSDCFVDLESEVDVKDALKKSSQYLDKRCIEVFRATTYEFNFHVKHKGMVSWREPVIRMSGLPFACTMADVQNFFENIEIAKNGIYITRDMADKALGDGFVAFVNMDNAYKAIDMHDHKHIQHRYIELFPSTYDEGKRRIMNDARSNARQFVGEDEDDDNKNNNNNNNNNNNINTNKRNYRSRSHSRQRSRSLSQGSYTNYRRRSRSRSAIRRSSSRNEEHLVKIRGMPYTVVEDDIRKFFPESCQPSRIEILQDRRMKRPNGDAHLYYNTLDEVNEALKYDRKYMGSRYVEIYFDSPRYSSLSNRRRKTDGTSRRSSRSPSKPKYNRYSRSRSIYYKSIVEIIEQTMSTNSTTTTETFDEHLIGPFAVVPKTDCPHLRNHTYTLPQSAHRVHGRQPACTDCGETRENWACLEENCSQIGCSRYQQKHMLAHHQSTGHSICLSLSDHSFYCYACESYIDSPKLTQVNEQLIASRQQ